MGIEQLEEQQRQADEQFASQMKLRRRALLDAVQNQVIGGLDLGKMTPVVGAAMNKIQEERLDRMTQAEQAATTQKEIQRRKKGLTEMQTQGFLNRQRIMPAEGAQETYDRSMSKAIGAPVKTILKGAGQNEGHGEETGVGAFLRILANLIANQLSSVPPQASEEADNRLRNLTYALPAPRAAGASEAE